MRTYTILTARPGRPIVPRGRPAGGGLPSRIAAQALRERGRAPLIFGDDENRVVAGDGADGLAQLRPIDGDRERLRLRGAGAHDDEMPGAIDFSQTVRGDALERGQRRRRGRDLGAGRLVGAVTRALDQTEVLDVTRDGGL